ncbi:hypothetical protein [Legionella saoudiensis]|uniref:hypothetical protein n=1 Tax=Legionella saoudiensis TaxID=1750561 RepID=UPI000730F698|nr:hypothetical protein [Legionella saoudiensis]
MDFNHLMSQSPKVLTVLEAIKNDPNFLEELKASPQEALSKIGVELDEEELSLVQKLESFEEEAEGFFNKIKGLFGFKDTH